MTVGTIKKYFEDRGFGFVKPDSGSADLFFHVRSFVPEIDVEPMMGDRVEYEVGNDPATGKLRAEKLRLI
jgi:cold shock protein